MEGECRNINTYFIRIPKEENKDSEKRQYLKK